MSQQRTNMRIFLVISTLLVAAQCQSDVPLTSLFDEDTSNEGDTVEKNKCPNIQADITGCNNCYPCEHNRINSMRAQNKEGDIVKLNLTSHSCETMEFCCIQQKLLGIRNKDKCGGFNPEGVPRSVRSSLRSVLPGEYPWRAWLYNSTHLLCAATYIREDIKAFITSASCIKDNLSGPLYVRFNKNGKPSEVTKKVLHPGAGTDIAVLQVKELPATSWILPCCMPDAAVRFGTTCIAISDDDHFIYTAIPKPSVCASKTAGSVGVLCAVAPSTDYQPAPGSALICLDHNSRNLRYMVHGIALETSAEGYTKYSDVFHHYDWLDAEMNNFQPSFSSGYRPSYSGYHG